MGGIDAGCSQDELREAVKKAEAHPSFRAFEVVAKMGGFRHATWEERWLLSRDELYCWRGTTWVRTNPEKPS